MRTKKAFCAPAVLDPDDWSLRHGLNAGCAILYADRMTDSMKRAIDETDRRRAIQVAYNQEHGITPESIIRPLSMSLAGIAESDYVDMTQEAEGMPEFKTQEELDAYIEGME